MLRSTSTVSRKAADASFPVAGVETLPRVGEVADHGAMVVGGRSPGELEGEGATRAVN